MVGEWVFAWMHDSHACEWGMGSGYGDGYGKCHGGCKLGDVLNMETRTEARRMGDMGMHGGMRIEVADLVMEGDEKTGPMAMCMKGGRMG